MNILSFDIEDWYFISKNDTSREAKLYACDKMLQDILDLLELNHCKGTFFCLGRMAKENPEVIKKIHSMGHEIGCHSDTHRWLNKMSYKDCLEDTRSAIDSLEQCIGEKIKSYRAPAFSIDSSNCWAFEILYECGITRDSSVYPSNRSVGGFPDFGAYEPVLVKYGQATIKEFPIAMTTLFGRKMAFSGGGYFRFFPLFFILHVIRNSSYNISYFHLTDLQTEKKKFKTRKEYESYYKESGTLKARAIRYFKSNLGKKNAWEKLKNLVNNVDFVSLEKADECIEWNKAKEIIFKN